MMIIGKYFQSNNDYINVMKISKRYHDLAQMYHFNPISDCSLFENMETQHLYQSTDKWRKGMIQYVYWYDVDYEEYKNKAEVTVFKRIVLNKQSLKVINGKCIISEGVTSIGNGWFSGCMSLTSVQLPSTLLKIGDEAFSSRFEKAEPLQQVVIPKNCEIGYYSFEESCLVICK